MAAISARHCDRVPQSDPKRGVGAVVGRCVLGFEPTSCDLVRRGTGKPCSAACPSIGRAISVFRSGTAFLSVRTRASSTGTRSAFLSLAQHGALRVGVQNASHAAAPGAASGAGAVVRRARLRHRYHRGELPGRASPGREFSRASRADSCSPASRVGLGWR